MTDLNRLRGELEDRAERLTSHFSGDEYQNLSESELSDMTEELAGLVSVYFSELDWQATMTELQERWTA